MTDNPPADFGRAPDLDFGERLASLCSLELPLARRDPERMGGMIERLSAALGMAIAVAARGNPQLTDEMIAGAEGYIHAEAVAKAPLAAFLALRPGEGK